MTPSNLPEPIEHFLADLTLRRQRLAALQAFAVALSAGLALAFVA